MIDQDWQENLICSFMLQEAEGGRGGAGEDPAAVTHREVMYTNERSGGRSTLWNNHLYLFCFIF